MIKMKSQFLLCYFHRLQIQKRVSLFSVTLILCSKRAFSILVCLFASSLFDYLPVKEPSEQQDGRRAPQPRSGAGGFQSGPQALESWPGCRGVPLGLQAPGGEVAQRVAARYGIQVSGQAQERWWTAATHCHSLGD